MHHAPARLTPSLLRRPRLSALALGAALLAGTAAQAQELPSSQPLWEVGAFAGALSAPAYPAANQRQQRALALPFFIYRGEVLRADRNGVGARLLQTERVEFDLGFAGALPASSDDIDLRRGMPDLGTLIEFGPRLKMQLAAPAAGERLSLELPLRAVLEFNGGVRTVGYALEPKLAYEWSQAAAWRLKASLSLMLGDQQLGQYFYGVAPAYATASRPAFEAQAGLISTRLGLDASTRLGPDVNLFVFARHDLHGGAANRNSPLFAQDQGTTLGLGLSWTLGRSEARARREPL